MAGVFALAVLGTAVQAQTQPTFPGFPTTPGTSGYGSGGTVYTPFNPLGGGTTPGVGTTYPTTPGYPGYPYYPQYYMDPVGSYLYGSSAVLNSVGQFQMNQESAQVIHQLALQKQIETTKMLFDLEKYIRENTPTFTEKQMFAAKETLKRILQNATPGEVWNGRALNVLLTDLKKQPDLDKAVAAGKIPEDTLRQLNITYGANGNLGILKNKGQFSWPLALLDDKLIPKEQREDVQIQAEQLVKKALTDFQDPNLYKDLKANINSIRDKLESRVLTMDMPLYMQAKRFLDNFDDALLALSSPTMGATYMKYLEFTKGGKTLPELVNYIRTAGCPSPPPRPATRAPTRRCTPPWPTMT